VIHETPRSGEIIFTIQLDSINILSSWMVKRKYKNHDHQLKMILSADEIFLIACLTYSANSRLQIQTAKTSGVIASQNSGCCVQ
jgi:hypothetical protein